MRRGLPGRMRSGFGAAHARPRGGHMCPPNYFTVSVPYIPAAR